MTDEISISIPSDPRYLKVARNVMENVVAAMGFPEPDDSRMVMAFDEACSNIIRHSCDGDRSIKISITFGLSSDELTITITDHGKCGKGFDPECSKPKDLDKEVTPGGFGVSIIKCVMDKVEYSSWPEKGNVLVMTKRLKPAT